MHHLPLVDFLPFKVGANIPAQLASAGGDVTTTLVYRDRLSGELREFALQDTSWYDTLRWEYVDTRIEERMPSRSSRHRRFFRFRFGRRPRRLCSPQPRESSDR